MLYKYARHITSDYEYYTNNSEEMYIKKYQK